MPHRCRPQHPVLCPRHPTVAVSGQQAGVSRTRQQLHLVSPEHTGSPAGSPWSRACSAIATVAAAAAVATVAAAADAVAAGVAAAVTAAPVTAAAVTAAAIEARRVQRCCDCGWHRRRNASCGSHCRGVPCSALAAEAALSSREGLGRQAAARSEELHGNGPGADQLHAVQSPWSPCWDPTLQASARSHEGCRIKYNL
jgi:hypothetical protein